MRMYIWIILFIIVGCSFDKPNSIDNSYISKSDIVKGKYLYSFNEREVKIEKYFTEIKADDSFKNLHEFIDISVENKISVSSIYYNTKVNNKIVKASGLIAYPTKLKPKGVIFFPHYFISDESSNPTSKVYVMQLGLAFLGYIVITPDIIGFGATKDFLIPTYLQNDITGRYCTDMLFASQEYLLKSGVKMKKKINIVGYSLGGISALAFQKYIETNKKEVGINKVYAGGGMYDPISTIKYISKNHHTDYPVAIPMLILSSNYWDNLNLNLSNIFRGSLLKNYEEWLYSKKYYSKFINKMLTNDINNFITEGFLRDDNNIERKKVFNSINKQSLMNWKPIAPIVLYHSKSDTYVPYLNAVNFYDTNKKRGCDIILKTSKDGHVSFNFVSWMFYDIIKSIKISEYFE